MVRKVLALSPKARLGVHQAPGKVIEKLHPGLEVAPGPVAKACGKRTDPLEQHGSLGTQKFCRGGRGVRAPVGSEIGNGGIGLVSDARHHRQRAGADRPCDRFLVECPEIFN